ncbi:hypothetical protein [Isoptericola sp. NPDC019571]|uniref:hypothetical protein n=1 Tax=Isoptericola sp. NPDC019571 TaxID=3364008 RepID=UPI0037B9C019
MQQSLPIGAGHVGYNPKQKNDKRKYDTCTKAISCVRTVRDEHTHTPVRVRSNYTAYANTYFAKSPRRSYADITVDRTGSIQRARSDARHEGINRKRAAEREAAAAAAAAQEKERGDWFGNLKSWAASDKGQAASQVLSTVALGIGVLAMVSNPVGWVAGVAIGGSMLLGAASTGIDCVNGMSGGCALGILGTLTGGAGYALKAARAVPAVGRAVRGVNESMRMPGEAASDIIGNGVDVMSDVMGTSFDTIGLSYSTAQTAGWIRD